MKEGVQRILISFIVSAFIGFGLGYLIFDVLASGDSANPSTEETSDSQKTTSTETEEANTDAQPTEDTTDEESEAVVASEDTILQAKGCLSCHSVSGLNLTGGTTGPDLTGAFAGVEDKHGKPLSEFLKEPTSAVMSGVIGGNPLTDDEIGEIVLLLEEASKSQ